MSCGKQWAAASACSLARKLCRARRAEVGFSRAQALAFRASAFREALDEHWRLGDVIGFHNPSFAGSLAAARLVLPTFGDQAARELLALSNWAKHAAPPGAQLARATPAGPSVVRLEAFCEGLYSGVGSGVDSRSQSDVDLELGSWFHIAGEREQGLGGGMDGEIATREVEAEGLGQSDVVARRCLQFVVGGGGKRWPRAPRVRRDDDRPREPEPFRPPSVRDKLVQDAPVGWPVLELEVLATKVELPPTMHGMQNGVREQNESSMAEVKEMA